MANPSLPPWPKDSSQQADALPVRGLWVCFTWSPSSKDATFPSLLCKAPKVFLGCLSVSGMKGLEPWAQRSLAVLCLCPFAAGGSEGGRDAVASLCKGAWVCTPVSGDLGTSPHS